MPKKKVLKKKATSGSYGDDFTSVDWSKVSPPTFLEYHQRIENAIVKACKGKKSISDAAFLGVYKAVEECSSELVKSILGDRKRQNEDLNVGAIDTCWMSIFCLGVVSYCWSMAVARGKSIDRKRDNPGRKGWNSALESFPTFMDKVYNIGREIGTLKVSQEGDLNLDIQIKRLTKELLDSYAK